MKSLLEEIEGSNYVSFTQERLQKHIDDMIAKQKQNRTRKL